MTMSVPRYGHERPQNTFYNRDAAEQNRDVLSMALAPD